MLITMLIGTVSSVAKTWWTFVQLTDHLCQKFQFILDPFCFISIPFWPISIIFTLLRIIHTFIYTFRPISNSFHPFRPISIHFDSLQDLQTPISTAGSSSESWIKWRSLTAYKTADKGLIVIIYNWLHGLTYEAT